MLSLSISPRGSVGVVISLRHAGGNVPVNSLGGGVNCPHGAPWIRIAPAAGRYVPFNGFLALPPKCCVFMLSTTREPARFEALAMNCMLPRFMAPSSELLLLEAAWSTSIKGNPTGRVALEFARVILNEGASAFKANDEGKTAVHVSAEHGHLAVTKLLVRADRPHLPGDEDFRWRRPTPLHLAAHKDTWRL